MVFSQALADPYFKGLAKVEREPSCQPITKMEFEFERRRVTKEDIRELIFREILEYHPQLLKDYVNGTERTNFLYPRCWPDLLSFILFIHLFSFWVPTFLAFRDELLDLYYSPLSLILFPFLCMVCTQCCWSIQKAICTSRGKQW